MQPLIGLIGDEMELTPDNIDEVLSTMGISGKDMTTMGIGFAKDKCFSSDWSDYFDTTDSGSTFNKYATDKLTVLQSEDDAATVNMGSEHRMPTQDDFEELINNCIITFIDLYGNEFSQSEAENNSIAAYNLRGVKFTGSNGNSIFVPAGGGSFDSTVTLVYYSVCLWSSILNINNTKNAAWTLNVKYSGDFLTVGGNPRSIGQAVRGVKSK